MDSYKFGQKNNWRRRMWNHLRCKLSDPKTSVGLYLPGPEALDVPVAVSKGFDARNLIGVERDLKIAKQLRRRLDGPIIHGSLADVVRDWTAEPKLAFIFADMCSHSSAREVRRFLVSIKVSRGLHLPCTVILNLQRGREKPFPGEDLFDLFQILPFASWLFGVDPKHRCFRLMLMNAISTLTSFNVVTYASYRSGVTMDSVVFQQVAPPYRKMPKISTKLVIRKIAAAKAVRATRI